MENIELNDYQLIIDDINNQLKKKDDVIDLLHKEISIKNNQLIEYHRNLMKTKERLYQIERSNLSNLFINFFKKNIQLNKITETIVEVVPLQQIKLNADGWVSTGNDPQFALVTSKHWQEYLGWYWLKMTLTSEENLNGQLFFNIGNGYTSGLMLDVSFSGNCERSIPIYLHGNCISIRFDPCEFATQFKINSLSLIAIDKKPELTKEFSSQFNVYHALGVYEGNITDLVPINTVVPDCHGKHMWKAESDDPWFLLNVADEFLQPGWHKIELCMYSSIQYTNAKLYFEYGEGYSEENSLELPMVSGLTTSRLFRLHKKPNQIRFDPVDSAIRFSIKKLDIKQVSNVVAERILIKRLIEFDDKLKNKSTIKIKNLIKKKAEKENRNFIDVLLERYNTSFTRKSPEQIKYLDWIVLNEEPVNDEVNLIENINVFFSVNPVISLVVPVYNTDIIYLRKAIDSVINQSYQNWELCIADDCSPDQAVRDVLTEYSVKDKRIKVVFRQENGHISAASNSALAIATGEFVALLDHDDELSEHALFHVVEAINHHPSASVIYSDEDKIDEQGNRSEPHFKPDWNPDQFFSQNYISHLGVYRRALLTKIGGFRVGVEGSQDQDLLLRCLPHIDNNDIVHIPKVLYHWRALKGSTALDSSEKSYTTTAGMKALKDYFISIGQQDVVVENGMVPNTYRIRYPIAEPQPLVSLLIPTRDMLSLLKACIDSIINKTTYQNYEILILDNGSVMDETLAYFAMIQANDHRVKVLEYNHPFNYSAINNFGVTHAKGDIIGLVNNDIEVISPEWLTEMVSHALRPEIGCVGAKLYYDDDTIQHAGVIIGLGGVAGHSHKHFPREAPGYFYKLKITHNLSAVTAACLLLRKSIFEEVGGLEVEGLKIAFNDVDLCLKVREAGYRNLWTPYAELYHYESKSRGFEDTPEKIARFNTEIDFIKNKWGDKLKNDPFYSSNLTLAREDFSI